MNCLLGVRITRGFMIQYYHNTSVTIQYYCDVKVLRYAENCKNILQFCTFFQLQIMSSKENFANFISAKTVVDSLFI